MSTPQNSPSPSRGRGRGRFNSWPNRGRAFYRGRAHSPFRGRGGGNIPPDRDILSGLVPRALKTIDPAETAAMSDIAIHDLQYLASYNWDNKEDPTIIVPGVFPIYLSISPLTSVDRLSQDVARQVNAFHSESGRGTFIRRPEQSQNAVIPASTALPRCRLHGAGSRNQIRLVKCRHRHRSEQHEEASCLCAGNYRKLSD